MNPNPANPIIETICDEQARGHIVARAKPLMPGRFELDFADGSIRQYELPAGTTAEQYRQWWLEAQEMKNLEWCGMEELGVPAAPRIDPTSRKVKHSRRHKQGSWISSLKTLISVMAPPSNPAEVSGICDWREVEAWLGFALPDDYKEFVTTYGSGSVDDFLWVLNPFSRNRNLNLIEQAAVQVDVQQQVANYSGDAPRYPLFPHVNGLFPWGITDNGDVLYWLCDGAAAAWAIVICDSKAYRWQAFEMPMVDFLTGYLTKGLTVEIFPDDSPTERPQFRCAQDASD